MLCPGVLYFVLTVVIRSSLVLKPALAPSPWLVQVGMAALQSVFPPASEDTVATCWSPCKRTATTRDPISPSWNCSSPANKYIDHRGIALAGMANPCSHGNKDRVHNGWGCLQDRALLTRTHGLLAEETLPCTTPSISTWYLRYGYLRSVNHTSSSILKVAPSAVSLRWVSEGGRRGRVGRRGRGALLWIPGNNQAPVPKGTT